MSDQTMRYKLLGNSGLRVSELCLGAMTFGEDWGWGSSKDEARKIYDAFREAGGNFIDTANIYTLGASESFLGEFLAEDRRYVLPPKDKVMTSMEELIFQFKVVTDMALPRGESYRAVESSKGELGFFIASDGTSEPLRCHVRAPSLMSVQAVPLLARGRLLSDMMAIIGSLDFVMGEVDR